MHTFILIVFLVLALVAANYYVGLTLKELNQEKSDHRVVGFYFLLAIICCSQASAQLHALHWLQ